MILVDANLLLFATDEAGPFHGRASRWLEARLNGDSRVGLPWPSLLAFLRISTKSRASQSPLSADVAWAQVAAWLACPPAWVPTPTERHAEVLGSLINRYQLTGNLIPDAHLAALAIEHGLTVCSADTDFARFTELRWENPLAGGLSEETPAGIG
ncbi:MAG: TA system VapC family ribonuclease toxin [Acidimicrobiales bacterium]